jgi:hypothetical protein
MSMLTRRGVLGAAAVLAGSSAVSRAQAASIPEAPSTTTNTMQPPLLPTSGPDYQPIVTLNGWYACLIPGHLEAGMHGTVVVK